MNNNNYIEKYKESLNSIEKKALTIAEKNLESSFDIEKSIGFVNFINEKENDMVNADYKAVGVLSTALGGKRINDV
jgi:hypothetical protein|tara:strand:- start:1169 stop:1396 length:228 start_codon:yes stop_codon:yes gene_type:complete